MNDEAVADLKDFMATLVSQQTADLKKDMARMETRLDGVESKLDDLQSFVSEALTSINDTVHEQLQDHEHRITKLEHATA